MKRRDFIAAIGGATTLPSVVLARPTKPAIGFLSGAPAIRQAAQTLAFLQGLRETGYVEGQNVVIEYRWADGHYDRLRAMAADLVRRHVDVIAAVAGSAPGLAAKAATKTIPIVFQTGSDPIGDGLVASMNRPDANVTGVTRLSTAVEPKRLELLHRLVPNAGKISFLVNPTNPAADHQTQEMQAAAHSLGLELEIIKAATEQELKAAFADLAQRSAAGILIATDPFLGDTKSVELAADYKLPVAHFDRIKVAAGSLFSYGASLTDTFRLVGVYVGRILKGEKPADLPVVQPTKFELVINLKAAKALGLSVPSSLLFTADEVIE